jgi:hypothetical protein
MRLLDQRQGPDGERGGEEMDAIDLIVKTNCPHSVLDMRMISFSALTHEEPISPGVFRVRCVANTIEEAQAHADFIEYVISKQGYGEVLRTEEVH